ncbi:MAG TPA: TonB-dependent receptor [Gammaproteobacteria bacterium]|nr:TonB-dependent receptor [Gammaproteobacteria bacterium]HIL97698.1 TonB-dependent receptor [Pseudomonadales bacterium]
MTIGPSNRRVSASYIFKKLPIASAIGILLVIPQAVNAASSRQIEEVIVTAERQEASVQDTSISITAFTSEMLDDFGIRNQEDLQNFVPATTIQPYDATVRGVGRNFRALGGDPGVSTYMNGVYSEDLPTATHAGFWDVERIEVLRGPQGTLYGRNAVGGAINILYNQPTQDLDYAFKVIGGSFGTEEYYGMINGPIIDDVLSARVNFGVRDRDGVIDEIGPYSDLDSLGRKNLAVQLQWTPAENLEFNVRANKMENDRIFGGANGGGLVVLNELGVDQRDTSHIVPGFRRIDTTNTAPGNYSTNDWYDQSQPILNFTDPSTGAAVQAQHNRIGVDLAEFDGFQNAAASLDGFNQTSQASADVYNDCVFPGDIDGSDVCAATNGINNEIFNQQGVQSSAIWDVTENLRLKYIYGYNKLSYERTTDDDNTASAFHDRQFYVNHEAKYESHELQAFYDFTDSFSITTGIFFYDSVIDQRGDFYSTLDERRYIDPYQDNTGLAPIFFGNNPMATLHSARTACEVADPAPSCSTNYAVDNNPNTNDFNNNNLYISTWQGDDGTLPDLDVVHGINSLGSDLLYHTQTHKEAFAAYAQSVWDINDVFTLTTGIRYAEDEVTAEENLFRYIEAAGGVIESILAGAVVPGGLASYNIINGGLVADASVPGGFAGTELAVNGGIPAAVSVYRPFKRKDDKITWRINLDWNYSDSGLMYFSATTGTRAGGHNLVFFSATPTYDPEELLAWEIGLKSQYFNDSLQVNASVYLYDYDTIHTVAREVVPPLTDFGGTATTTTSVLEAPGADIYGVEVEVLWLTTDNLSLGGNFSFTPSEYTGDLFISDTSGASNPASLFPTFTGLTQNIKGNRVLQVPEMKYTGWASYNLPLSGGSAIEFFGVYSYIGEVYYTPFENDTDKADAYDRVDMRATWTSSEGNWTVTGFVNNVFNDVGVLQVLRQGEGENFRHTAGVTLPRMYGMELSYRL